MKLHALDLQRAVPHRHDLALCSACAYLELRRQTCGRGDQRVIAPDLARLRQACEQGAFIVAHQRSLAVHQAVGPHDLATKHLHDRLVSETHAQYRDAPGKCADHVHRYAGVVGRAGARRDAQVRGLERARRLGRQRVIAVDIYLRAEHQKGRHQVVGEGDLFDDQEQTLYHNPTSASSSARAMAALFASTSSCSFCGTLSATMPAPAWSLYSSPLNT